MVFTIHIGNDTEPVLGDDGEALQYATKGAAVNDCLVQVEEIVQCGVPEEGAFLTVRGDGRLLSKVPA